MRKHLPPAALRPSPPGRCRPRSPRSKLRTTVIIHQHMRGPITQPESVYRTSAPAALRLAPPSWVALSRTSLLHRCQCRLRLCPGAIAVHTGLNQPTRLYILNQTIALVLWGSSHLKAKHSRAVVVSRLARSLVVSARGDDASHF